MARGTAGALLAQKETRSKRRTGALRPGLFYVFLTCIIVYALTALKKIEEVEYRGAST